MIYFWLIPVIVLLIALVVALYWAIARNPPR
jgi:hypothetical protein